MEEKKKKRSSSILRRKPESGSLIGPVIPILGQLEGKGKTRITKGRRSAGEEGGQTPGVATGNSNRDWGNLRG